MAKILTRQEATPTRGPSGEEKIKRQEAAPTRRRSGVEVWGPAAFLIGLGAFSALLTLFVSLRLLAALVAWFGVIFALAVRRFRVGKKDNSHLATAGLALNGAMVLIAAGLAFFGPTPPRSLEKLVQALKSPKADVRQEAAVDLGKKGPAAAAALAELMDALNDAEPAVRCAAATAIGDIGPTARLAHFNLLHVKLTDADPAAAQAAKDALDRVGALDREEIHGLLEGSTPAVRSACAVGLWQLALRSSNAAMRVEAIGAIGKNGPAAAAAVADLLEALADADPAVRCAAAAALGDIGPRARVAFFDLLLACADAPQEFTTAAQNSVKRIGRPSPADVDDFQVFLSHERACVRAAAAKSLWCIGPAARKAIPGLETGLDHTDVWVRLWSAQALCTLKHDPARLVLVLRKTVNHQDPKVRGTTVHMLKELGPLAGDALGQLTAQLGEEKDAKIAVGIIETIGSLGENGKKAAIALRSALRKEAIPVRRAAALALAQVHDDSKETQQALTKALGDADAAVCGQSILSLASFGPSVRDIAGERLRDALRHREPKVRGLAVDALGHIEAKDEKTVLALRDALLAHAGSDRKNKTVQKEPEAEAKESLEALIATEVSFKICMVLAAFGPASRPGVPALTKAMDHSQPKVRAAAIHALFQIGIDGKDRLTLEALTLALADADDDVCLQAIRAVQSCGPEAKDAVSPLIKLLGGRGTGVRAGAAAALGKIGVEARAAIPALADALDDPEPQVRLQAATVFTLGPFRGDAGKQAGGKVVANPVLIDAPFGPWFTAGTDSQKIGTALCKVLRDPDPNLRVIATYALANIQDDSQATVEVLAQVLLEDRDIRVREGAASALRTLRSKNAKAVAALCQALVNDRKSREVRLFAAQALTGIADSAVIASLETAARNDGDSDVKAAAEAALKLAR